MEKILSIENVSKEFGGKTVVDKVSFDVFKGDIMGVLGPNGAGKSTIIRSIMGIIYPDSGDIRFSFSAGKNRIHSKIGYLPEERGLYKDVKIMDVLLYLSDLKNYPRNKAKARILEYLEKLDLKGKEREKIESLSKGMAQKVQFIASVLHEPPLLILDEPFSGLDPVSQDVFKEEIRSLAKAGTTILLSAHQMNLVEELCSKIFLINKGKKVIYGDLQTVKEEFADFKCIIIGNNKHVDFLKLASVEKVEKEENKTTIFFKRDSSANEFLSSLPKNVDVKELHMDRISLHDIFVNIAKGGVTHAG